MRSAWKVLCGALLLLPVMAAGKPRAMFGVMPDAEEQQGGVLVRAVHPASPAGVAGVQAGDVILSLDGTKVDSREEMRAVLQSLQPGHQLEVELLQGESRRVLQVKLAERPVRPVSAAASPDAAVGGDRMLRPLVVNPAIRTAMREHRMKVLQQLGALPDGLQTDEVITHLQALRHLARDANPQGRGWMLGEAGEVTLQFKDAHGVLVLHGANKLLTLTVYDAAGMQTHTLPLNTEAERQAVPEGVIERLRRLR